MNDVNFPRPFPEWSDDPHRRAEDAAYAFGHDLMRYCRAEAMKALGDSGQESDSVPRAHAERAVDAALHNVMDPLEGFFGPLRSGPQHRVEYVLSVSVRDAAGTEVEQIALSPCKLDLPVGYWKWRDGEFR